MTHAISEAVTMSSTPGRRGKEGAETAQAASLLHRPGRPPGPLPASLPTLTACLRAPWRPPFCRCVPSPSQ